MTTPNGRLLIVSPAFHGYWVPIESAFRQLGWEVTTHRYDELTSKVTKTRLKLGTELPRMLGLAGDGAVEAELTLRARDAVVAHLPDRVLVIKGDTLGAPFWDALNSRRVPRSLWLYDELRRTFHTEQTLDQFDGIASYSRLDTAALAAAGRNSTYVPLAFDPANPVAPRFLNDVTFIGARYPRREALLRSLCTAGVPVRAFGRSWSRHPFDRARTWRWDVPPFPTGRDLTLAAAYAVMAGSPATLNIHGDQDGFTMRTFEAAGVGGVQLVDRADVAEFYEPGIEVAVFASDAELVDLARRAIADDRWGDRLRVAARRRTLAEHTFLHRARALEATWG
jgi:spore maturation protein CgeB